MVKFFVGNVQTASVAGYRHRRAGWSFSLSCAMGTRLLGSPPPNMYLDRVPPLYVKFNTPPPPPPPLRVFPMACASGKSSTIALDTSPSLHGGSLSLLSTPALILAMMLHRYLPVKASSWWILLLVLRGLHKRAST